MTFQDDNNERPEANLRVRFVATCRRMGSITEVIHDTTDPWVRGGRAQNIIESAASAADVIRETSGCLLVNLCTAAMLLRIESLALREFRSQRPKTEPAGEVLAQTEPDESPQMLLSLVCAGARETADLIRSFWTGSEKWCSSELIQTSEQQLDFVLRSIDYTRWQILKEFAKLVVIFDDHDDHDSKEVPAEWRRDLAALHGD
jgi:hypothetical protein